jgi:hypothetical protein
LLCLRLHFTRRRWQRRRKSVNDPIGRSLPRISTLSATALLSEFDVGSRLFCQGAADDRLGACTSIEGLIANATRQIIADIPGAHATLAALQTRAQAAGSAGVFSAMEIGFISEVATAANSRF